LATQIERAATLGENRLAQIIVEALFGIGVSRVEFSESCMGHGILIASVRCCEISHEKATLGFAVAIRR
jgi:hypothetical protein